MIPKNKQKRLRAKFTSSIKDESKIDISILEKFTIYI